MNEKDLIKLWNQKRSQIIMAQIAPSLVLIAIFVLAGFDKFTSANDGAKYLAIGVAAVTGILAIISQYAAVREGEGAYVVENILGKEVKRKLKVSAVSKISDASLAFAEVIKKDNWEGNYDKFLKLTNDVWRSRGFGDFWGHMLVAEGAVDMAIEPKLALWDMAALYLIIKEAGGSFTNLKGVDGVDGPGAISSNTLLHNELLARFA